MNKLPSRAALCILCAALAAPASAADPPAPLFAYRNASVGFNALLKDAEDAHDPARLKSEEAAKLVAVLADDHRFLKPGIYTVAELRGLNELCGLANQANMSLALFGAKDQVDPKAERQVVMQQISALMEANILANQVSSLRLQSFTLRCYAKQIPPTAEFIAAMPPEEFTEQRRQSLRQLRTGLNELVVGTLQAMNDTRFEEDYRLSLAQVTAETAPVLLQALPLAERKRLRAVVDGIGAPPPKFAPYVARIIDALEHAGCSVLCEL